MMKESEAAATARKAVEAEAALVRQEEEVKIRAAAARQGGSKQLPTDGGMLTETTPAGEKRGRRNRIHPRNWGYTTYIDRVFGMRCFEDLVRMRVFPDAKDISESYGALQAAIRRGLGGGTTCSSREAERRRGVLCIAIGDGATARSACLAAYLTSWNAVSVDPALREEWAGQNPHGVGRLRCDSPVGSARTVP
jgi:hypothetical protein